MQDSPHPRQRQEGPLGDTRVAQFVGMEMADSTYEDK